MKKIIIPVLIACLGIGCTESKYRISGNIDGLDGWVYMWHENGQTDSLMVTDGSFVFEGPLDEPFFAQVFNKSGMFVFLIPDGENITITENPDKPGEIEAKGSPLTDKVKVVMARLSENEFYKIANEQQREEAFTKWKNDVKEIVSENRDNVIGVLALTESAYFLPADNYLEYAGLLSPKMRENDNIKKGMATARQKKLTEEGSKFIEITQNDVSGKETSLSDFVGKGQYILVDFWASWCGPCIAEIPELKKVYEKYHPKGFEIFGVSLDTNEDSWKKAIKKYGLNWLHVSSLKGWDCPAAASYAVRGIPNTFLIGPDGTIAKKDPSTSELDAILSKAYN